VGLYSHQTELTPELREAKERIEAVARAYGLDFFDTIFEMVDYEQINALAAYGGFPVRYPHWRWGMDYDQLSKGYEWGLQKIYEMVINTNPSYAYLMRSNSLTDQKMVMAHVYGHVDFFKNNDWFAQTNRRMLDTMANHAVKVRDLMDQYGYETVENFIDQVLTLEPLIDPQLPFLPKTREGNLERQDTDTSVGKLKNDRPYMEKFINPPEFLEEQAKLREAAKVRERRFPPEPVRDVLGFLMEHAPLEEWQRSILSIIRDEAYYFAPQAQTKIMNEGWASYWHSKMMTEKILNASEIIDYADNHSGTMATAPGRINPYKIGIELFRDIEDRWNRGKFGKEYEECESLAIKTRWDQKLQLGRKKIFEVRKVCNDITFIDEYLTEEFVERYQLYTYGFNRRTQQYEIVDRDFKKVKEKLLNQLTNRGQPLILVQDGNLQNKGELLLGHRHQGVDLDQKYSRETLQSLFRIWSRPVHLETEVEGQKKLLTWSAEGFSEKFL
jgi:stage V sporulation protein R